LADGRVVALDGVFGDSWIGSSGIDMKVIAEVANGSLADGSDFIFAEDISQETAKERQQRNRYKGPRYRIPKPTQGQMDSYSETTTDFENSGTVAVPAKDDANLSEKNAVQSPRAQH
jgi:hypothetical protein